MMTQACDLSNQACEPLQGDVAALDAEQANRLLEGLHPDWQLSSDNKLISRRFKFKDFAKAVETGKMIAWLGDRHGHQPDITFGWCYCAVSFRIHEVDEPSNNNLVCAAKLDQMTSILCLKI